MAQVYEPVILWYDETPPRIRLSSDVREDRSAKDRSMITTEHLTKRFGSHTAVDDVSFVVKPGQVT
ncbi:MAG: hypothetical protein ACTH8K_04160, partial [Microbacterium gubbeenense]